MDDAMLDLHNDPSNAPWLASIARGLGRRLRAAVPIFVAVILSFSFGAILLVLTGQNPIDAYAGLIEGAFGSRSAFAGTLTTTTPLIFSALAFLISYRAGIFNAGTEGQLLVGAFFAAWMGFTFSNLFSWAHIPAVLLAGAIGGAVWAFFPALWRLYFGVDEVVTTLMMNFIAVSLNEYLVLYVYRNPTVQAGTNAQTADLAQSAIFPSIFPPYAVTFALPMGIVVAVLLHWVLFRTVFGYELRMGGQQRFFAEYGGISAKRTRMLAMLISGALAGLGGAAQVAGVFYAYITPFTAGLGFDGVLISLLVRNNAFLVPFGAFFFGALQNGALKMQIFTNVSRYIIGVLTGTIILFASAQEFGLVRRGLIRAVAERLRRRRTAETPTRSG